jgi:hypothetical protein
MGKKQTELLDGQSAGLSYPFGRMFDPDQADGVDLHGNVLSPHRKIP